MKFYPATFIFLAIVISSCAGQRANISAQSEIKEIIIVPQKTYNSQIDYEIKNVTLKGDTLQVTVNYRGGKAFHSFDLYFDGKYKKSLPRIATLYIEHKQTEETCEKYITKKLSFNIAKLKENSNDKLFLEILGYPGKFLCE